MGLVGDRDRERTAEALRRHYLEGRISEEELDERLEATLRARTRLDLVLASRSLPRYPPFQEIAATASLTVTRVVTFVLLAGLWAVVSFVLLATLLLVALFGDVSDGTALAFTLVWLGMTWLVWRHWRSGPRHR